MAEMTEVERMLRSALVPVEPSERLSDRLERRLVEWTDAAAEELADWELSAMRDPRNWVRPVVAVVAGSAAAGALAVLRARQIRAKRQATRVKALERSVREVAGDLQRRLGR